MARQNRNANSRGIKNKVVQFAAVACVCALLGFVLFVFFGNLDSRSAREQLFGSVDGSDGGSHAVEVAEPLSRPDSTMGSLAKGTGNPLQTFGGAVGEQTLPEQEREDIPGSDLWFVDPGLKLEGNRLAYTEVPKIAIDWDPTCAHHRFIQYDDLSVLVQQGLYLDPKDYLQSNHLALQFTQFWKSDDLFQQFGYKWEQNSPQTFSLEAYSSADRYMNRDVKRIALKELSEDPAGTTGFFGSQLQNYLRSKVIAMLSRNPGGGSAAGTMGARVALFQVYETVTGSEEVEVFEVGMRNSTVISVTSSQMTCRKSEKVNKSFCACRSEK